MAKNKKNNLCSSFEEMLMWTSYRYCIGRKTYVSCMASEIAQNYYNRLTDERKQFTSGDIRQEIYSHLRFLPFDFDINRWYNNDEFNPIKVLLYFFNEQKLEKFEDIFKYSKIQYNVNKDKYEFEKCEPTIKSYFSKSDIDDLLVWEDLASCFDIKGHKLIKLIDESEIVCFPSWRHKLIPSEKENYFRIAPFGWEMVWVPLDSYLVSGDNCGVIPNESIKEIKELNNNVD